MKVLADTDNLLKLCRDFGCVLLQIERKLSPEEIERKKLTDVDTKELMKFNNTLERRT